MVRVILSAALAATLGAAAPQAAPAPVPVPLVKLEVVARYPHDSSAFTQGLLWHSGGLYESTGREGQSEVRRVTLTDGRVAARTHIPAAQFGEGLALWKATLVSLTWKDGIAHRWDVATFKRQGESRYSGEGWGLTTTPEGLILSDGSANLRVLDPASFAERRRIAVTIAGKPLDQLNELEWVDGAIFANVWMTGYIVAIDPTDGHVTRVIDARPLVAEVAARDPDAVLNGIAWDADKKRLFVTGKLWPTMFEVKVEQATTPAGG